MTSSVRVPVQELNQVGEARRTIGRFCEDLGGDETFCGRVSLIVTELARNLVNHGKGGEIIFRALPHPVHRGIEMIALDRGPGMRNVGECLRDGYSTAGTPGTGMGAICRVSDFFDLTTTEKRGTVICTRLFPAGDAGPATRYAVGAVNVPLAGEPACGDQWAVIERGEGFRVLVADGLGHGIYAAEASRRAVAVFLANPERPLDEVLQLIHTALNNSRGAAAAVVELAPGKSELTAAGVGNVSVRILDRSGRSRQVASVNGTLGVGAHRIQTYPAAWTPESHLVVHTDGLSSHWDLTPYAGLFQRHPATIAGLLYRDFARARDDATVVVLSAAR